MIKEASTVLLVLMFVIQTQAANAEMESVYTCYHVYGSQRWLEPAL